MTHFKTATKTILLLATAGLLTVGAGASAFAQEDVGNVDVRALEAPVDVTPQQLRAQSLNQSQAPFVFAAPSVRY